MIVVTLLATVFDLDDTLADSAETWNQVMRTVAAQQGRWPERSDSECVDGMVDAIARGVFGLLPGAAELVALAAELGPVGLVSASSRRYVRAVASASGLMRHVQAIVTSDDVTGNPHLVAARKLGLDPVHCLAVEGSAAGIRSAHSAGMTVLAIPAAPVAGEVLRLAAHQASDARVAVNEICQLWVNVYALSR
jgi:beta-phosphoglucomutase-like phosphatase (HAD superfamily)